jgi:hypothetical protein
MSSAPRRWSKAVALLALTPILTSASACQKSANHAPPPALDTRPATLSSSAAPATSGDGLIGVGQADEVVAAMLERVTAVRGLSALHPVQSRVIKRAEMIQQVRAHVEQDVPSSALVGQGEFLTAMGYLPPSFNFSKGLFDLLESQVAGYYEPDDKRMYLVSDLGETETESTLAHELVHALQDQHYDLDARMKFRDDGSDRLAAIQCLAEGDAMAGMIDIEAGGPEASLGLPDELLATQMRAGVMLLPSIAAIPPIMKASLVAPYTDGLVFVQGLRRRGGFREVDRAWKRPPETTEQLLHLDKFDAHEPALTVPRPPLDAFGGGFTKLFGDSNGEQGTSLAFQEWGNARTAEHAAAGWGGDHFDVLVRGDEQRERFATWWIRFDPGAVEHCPEADEAFDFIRARRFASVAAKATSKTKQVAENTDVLCIDRPDLGPLAVTKNRCDVVFAAGPYERAESGAVHPTKVTCAEVAPWLASWVKGAGMREISTSPASSTAPAGSATAPPAPK